MPGESNVNGRGSDNKEQRIFENISPFFSMKSTELLSRIAIVGGSYCARSVFQYRGPSVKRYFFDVVGSNRRELDYSGRMLPTPESARDAAELLAIDLAVKNEGEAIGWSVNVSVAEGHKLFSIPVQESYLAAA
jgi:hypothetical protein